MNKLVFLLGASLFFSAVSAAGNVCKQGNIVNMGSVPYYWPSTWRENQTAPQLGKEQSCSWTVTIPKGYYAKLIINGKTTDKDSRFQMIDSAGNLVQTTHEGMQPYYFPPSKLTLAVSNEAVATFAFKIIWAPLPAGPKLIAGIGDTPHLVNVSDIGATAYSGILSLLIFPNDPKNMYHLRCSLVFQGTDSDGTYINNLHAFYNRRQQWVSTGGIYVVNLEDNPLADKDQMLVQSYLDTKQLNDYEELVCGTNTTCTFTINGRKGPSALVAVNGGNLTLTDIQMEKSANLSIYYGSISPFFFYKSYMGSEIQGLLPLIFDSSWVLQYVISSGKAVFTFAQ
ncbi:unnamed protein product [Caenorhabditis sp. 36 PRJEB53466]|nr:unnamed protein product [Caenorhabditis sp. 36 PRJEB53466]